MSIKRSVIGAQIIVLLMALSSFGLLTYAVQEWIRLDRIEEQAHKVNRTVNDLIHQQYLFLQEKDLDSYQKAVEQTSSLKQALNMLYQDEVDLGLNREQAGDIEGLLDQFSSNLAHTAQLLILIGLDEDSGLRGQFRSAAQQLQSLIQIREQPQLENLILELRRREKDYLLRKAPTYLALHSKLLIQTTEMIETSSSLSPRDKELALSTLERYRADFSRLVEVDGALGTTPTEGSRGKVRELARQLNVEITQIFRQSSGEVHDRLNQLVWIVGGLIFAVFLSCIALLGHVIRRIYRGMQDVSSGMNQIIQQQDYELRISAGNKDDFSQLSENINQLVAHFQEVLIELETTRARLIENEKMASLGGLVSGVAHEINTPLGAAISCESGLAKILTKIQAELKQGSLGKVQLEKLLEQSQEALQIIEANLTRTADVVSGFKKVAVQSDAEPPVKFSVGGLIEGLYAELSEEAQRYKARFEPEKLPDLEAHGAATSLSQALRILYLNAMHHGADKENPLTIKTRLLASDRDLVIVVEDDGVGMPSKTAEQVFDPFFTTNRSEGGSGLGLAVLYNLATFTFQGTVEVKSTPGHGTSVILTLPGLLREKHGPEINGAASQPRTIH